jgi:hypothetical protein
MVASIRADVECAHAKNVGAILIIHFVIIRGLVIDSKSTLIAKKLGWCWKYNAAMCKAIIDNVTTLGLTCVHSPACVNAFAVGSALSARKVGVVRGLIKGVVVICTDVLSRVVVIDFILM